MAVEIGRLRLRGHSSVMKIATPRLTGMPITIAITEVTSVP